MTRPRHTSVALAAALAAPLVLLADTPRVSIELGPNALPAQIAIAADPAELPLRDRAATGEALQAAHARIGRGPQLRAPVRLELVRDGRTETFQPAAPAARDGDRTVAVLQAGATKAQVQATVRGAALEVSVAYGGGAVESLALVIEPAGPIDLALAGTPGPDLDPAACTLKPGEGVAWSTAGAPPAHLFVGSGDRGWTLFGGDPAGWTLRPDAPAATLVRQADGTVTWRLFLVNAPATLDANRTAALTLLTHPHRFRPADARRQAWHAWPPEARATTPAPALTRTAFAAFQPGALALPAAAATPFEASVAYAVLGSNGGGDALAADRGTVARYPTPVFRYLAGTHAGQVRRIAGDSGTLIRAGAQRHLDRTLLGRALVHDVGVDVEALAHLADGARVLGILQRFGAFEDDGQTEFLPWWRSAGLLRFGEAGDANDAFALAPGRHDPASHVRVSAYRRPLRKGSPETQTLLVLFNEHDAPVRDQLYVLDPAAVFGRGNALKDTDVASTYDFSRLPEHNDWSKAVVVLENRSRTDAVLRDEEDHGVVRRVAARDGVETYGPLLYIGARDFRILYGRGR